MTVAVRRDSAAVKAPNSNITRGTAASRPVKVTNV